MEQDIRWSISKIGLPLVIMEQTTDEGHIGRLCFLIDTGASINIIYKFVCKDFMKSFIELEGGGAIIGFEGEEHKTQYVGICFFVEGVKYSGVFSVLDEYAGMKHIEENFGIQVHGVLGIPFLVNNGWRIDLKDMKVIG